jgi:hypothetical protein
MFGASGCLRSHMIDVTVTNTSNDKLSNITIDYPEASFGINLLPPGKSFDYKLKPTDTGALKISFSDARGHDHNSTGPVVHKGDQGDIEIKLSQEAATSEAKNLITDQH